MLSYAYQVLRQSNYEKIKSEDFQNINDLFSAILASGMGQQVKQGLYKEYVSYHDDLLTLKGKLDISGSIRNRINHKQSLACDFDILSVNNLFNQILKSTALYLSHQNDVSPENKKALLKVLSGFCEVDVIPLDAIPWSTLTYQRNNQSYRMLIYLCYFVVNRMLLTTSAGEYKMRQFTEEHMAALYEKFILQYYATHHSELHPTSKQIDFDIRESISDEARDFLPKMQSDIYLRKDVKVLIIDAKYYKHIWQVYDRSDPNTSETIRNAHLYQIMSYVRNEQVKNPDRVSGMLLYAQTGEKHYSLDFPNIGGNHYFVKTLDLNTDFEELKNQLDNIQSYI